MRKFAEKNCLATKQRKSILGVLAELFGVLVLCIGMVYWLRDMKQSELGMLDKIFS